MQWKEARAALILMGFKDIPIVPMSRIQIKWMMAKDSIFISYDGSATIPFLYENAKPIKNNQTHWWYSSKALIDMLLEELSD